MGDNRRETKAIALCGKRTRVGTDVAIKAMVSARFHWDDCR